MASNRTTHIVRFGVFEVDFRSRELRKHGSRIKLQSKPFQILEGLVEKHGEIVNREELRLRLWPGDTFVDFETGLNSAVKRLRDALGDSAERPRYIETISGQGYRFIAPVEPFTEPQPANAVTSPIVFPEQASLKTRPQRSTLVWLFAGLLVASGLLYIATRRPERKTVNFRQLTFRRGNVGAARFAPDGGVVYAAQWSSGGRQLFLTNSLSPESRPLGVQGMALASVSGSGELALLASDGTTPIAGATLLRTPMHGGAPAEVERNIMGADWSADGKAFAIVRVVAGMNQLEFPVGNVLYRTSGWLSGVRVSPSNRLIAFFEHPVRHDDAGTVKLIDRTGRIRALGGEWAIARGLAWHPSGQEVWFTATRDASAPSLWAFSLSGNLRPIGQTAGGMVLYDIARDGHILLSRETRRLEIAARFAGDVGERDLSWFDWSRVQEISSIGGLLLFDESGEGVGNTNYVTYLYRRGDQTTRRIGDGRAMGFSPDGQFVLMLGSDRTRFKLAPIGGGPTRDLPMVGLTYQWGIYFPDGKHMLALANEPNHGLRLYVQGIIGGKPQPLGGPSAVRNTAISHDGAEIAVLSANGKLTVYSGDASRSRIIPTPEPLAPISFTKDGRGLLVQHLGVRTPVPARVSRVDLSSGELSLWRGIAPADPTGVNSITRILVGSDEESYAYSYRRILSELFVVDGWR